MMKTTATNKKIREILTDIRSGKLVPRPEFQRRLVWSNKHKNAFIQTVLMDYPFPEIYIAIGDVDTATGEGKEMLVDGQQRVTTLYQYFTASKDLRLEQGIRPYANLMEEEKRRFLNYDVVVRDLGNVSMPEIIEVFRRINSTRYALNAMEIHNARFEGEFKQFGDELAAHPFFERHRVFYTSEIKRMHDTRYTLTIVATVMAGYFNRDDDLESFLIRYNDEFPEREDLRDQLNKTFEFVEACRFPDTSRAWKKTDLFTLLVEIYNALFADRLKVNADAAGAKLEAFYTSVDRIGADVLKDVNIERYYLATVQASNDKSSRITRGEIVQTLLKESAGGTLF